MQIECFCGVGNTSVHAFLVGVMARSRLLVSARDVYWLNRLWYFACGVFSLVRPFLSAMDVNSLISIAATLDIRWRVRLFSLGGA